jgi:fused signal recognition particle receptor
MRKHSPDDRDGSPEPSGGFWQRLRRGLGRSQAELHGRIELALRGRNKLDREAIAGLEEALLAADFGVATTTELIERVRGGLAGGLAGDEVSLRSRLADEIAVLLLDAPQPAPLGEAPAVLLVVGVNGVGKTTSIAKLAFREREQGRSVLLAAADTFRAAAIDQLVSWGERLGIEVIRQRPGADPAAVVFDALAAARARRIDRVIVDTAGRLHTKSHLMEELANIGRVIAREASERQRRTLLVLDATTGQNALAQAREFMRAAPIDGLLLAKVDGTAKGGMVVAVARDLRLPVLYLGVGEGPADLVAFRPREFATALLA